MTGQQYRVIADRDKGDDPHMDDVLRRDRVTWVVGELDGLNPEVIRIERPVPTADDTDYNAWHHGLPADVAAELSGEHPASLPTREQIAEVLWREYRGGPYADWATLTERDRDEWRAGADAVLALLQRGAEQEWPAADDGSDLTWRERNGVDRG